MKNLFYKIFGIKNDFEKLFFSNEFRDLTGRTGKSILALSLILALTISALGYAIGGIKYLKERMDNPFTNWVDLPINQSKVEKAKKIELFFEKQTNKDSFDIHNVTKYKIDFKQYLNIKDNNLYTLKTRTVGIEDDILKEILKPGNVVSGYSYTEGEELNFPKCGIVIKEQSLKENLSFTLGGEHPKYVFIKTDEFLFYPEVVAVVKELPNLCHALISNHYSNLLNTSFDLTGFVQLNPVNKVSIVGKFEEANEDKLKNYITQAFEGYDISDIEFDNLDVNTDNKLDRFTVTLFDFLTFEEIQAIQPKIESMGFMKNPLVDFKNECNVGDYSNLKNPHYLALNFNALDKVRSLNDFLKDDPRFNIEISMDQVESKENFALVSRLTGLIALILLAFSILSIVFYINSLLTKHLEGIKNNLGTLKAFGLNNKFLISVYLKIIFLFIVIAIVIGYIVSIFIKGLELAVSKIAVIDLFDYKIFLTMIVILLFSSYVSYNSIKKILLKTPGDLIYNR